MAKTKLLTKPRIVFLAWAIAELIGWLLTHFVFQDPRANWVWLVLSVLAFIPMVLYMPWKQPKMRSILLLWLISVAFGMVVSFLAFYLPFLVWIAGWLGAFWLILMGITFFLNAIWWSPKQCIVGGVVQVLAGVAVILLPGALLINQYLVAAVAGTLGMLILVPNPARFRKARA